MRNEALLKVLAGEMSNNMAYKLTMRSSMLIPPLDVLGPWSIVRSGEHKTVLGPRDPNKKHAAFLVELPPECLLLDAEHNDRMELQAFAFVHG